MSKKISSTQSLAMPERHEDSTASKASCALESLESSGRAAGFISDKTATTKQTNWLQFHAWPPRSEGCLERHLDREFRLPRANSHHSGLCVSVLCQWCPWSPYFRNVLAYAKVEENWKPLMLIGMGSVFNPSPCKVDKQIHERAEGVMV